MTDFFVKESEAICYFHAKTMARRGKAWFHLGCY